MAIYNTSSDAANTAVRAFLTKVGEYYLTYCFNTGSKKGKEIWNNIKEKHFQSRCAYCGKKSDSLQIEHVLMFNKNECGLHHPGNIVPCCKQCNKREFKENKKEYTNWKEHLKMVCQRHEELEFFEVRKQKILDNFKQYNYPELNDNERQAIYVIANSLYENIKIELDKSLDLYKK